MKHMFYMMTVCTIALCLSQQTLAQQTSQTAGGTTGNRNVSTGGTGTGLGLGIDTSAGVGEINTDFGDGLIGRSDTTDRFVGNQNVPTNAGNFQRNFQQRQTTSTDYGRSTRDTSIRPTIVLGFQGLSRPQSSLTIEGLNRSQVSLQNHSAFRSVNLTSSPDGVAVLTGSVANASDKRLAEFLIRLEPGISKVDNRIQLSPTGF